jgi:hypothetical protein
VQNIRDKLTLQKAALRELDDVCEDQYTSNRSILGSIQAILARQKLREDPSASEARRARQKADVDHAQDQLTKALVAFNRLRHHHRTLVPQSEMDNAAAELNRLQRSIQNYKLQSAQVERQSGETGELISTTREKIAALVAERDALEERTRAFTPRPEWERLPTFSGDVALEGMTSRDVAHEMYRVIDKLKDELKGFVRLSRKNASGGAEEEVFTEEKFFEPRGTDPMVPKYLCSDVPVRNRRMTKRDCESLIKEVMDGKEEHDAKLSLFFVFLFCFFIFIPTPISSNPNLEQPYSHNRNPLTNPPDRFP